MTDILIGVMLVLMLVLLSLTPLVLLALFYAQGLITREEAEQALRRMADGQVTLCGR